jgi:hypothetical protein
LAPENYGARREALANRRVCAFRTRPLPDNENRNKKAAADAAAWT